MDKVHLSTNMLLFTGVAGAVSTQTALAHMEEEKSFMAPLFMGAHVIVVPYRNRRIKRSESALRRKNKKIRQARQKTDADFSLDEQRIKKEV